MVGGKPLIAWTIAAVSKAYGAEVPFLRPTELAGDVSPHVAVVEHAIAWLAREEGVCPDFILLLQPTSPLRTGEDIGAAVLIAQDKQADSVVSISELHPHRQLATRLTAEGVLLDYAASTSAYVRRQDLPKYFAVNGALYLIRRDVFLECHSLVPPGTYGYVMPPERSLDVDTAWDLRLADLILRSRHEACASDGRSEL
jgi:N-acylneuraminate cytidylyltransferase/CMP-N,N'-diacetyllegionaminic acid synthase